MFFFKCNENLTQFGGNYAFMNVKSHLYDIINILQWY